MKNIVRSDRRIKSFLAGCFLGSGSVSNPKKTDYHLEMAFVDESFAKEVARLMEKINFYSVFYVIAFAGFILASS